LLRLFFSVRYRCVLSVLFMVTSNRAPLLCFAIGTVFLFLTAARHTQRQFEIRIVILYDRTAADQSDARTKVRGSRYP